MQRVIHSQERLQQHKVEYGVSNSTLEFERLRKQVKKCRTFDKRVSLECMSEDSITQVQHIEMNSQKARQTVEVSQEQYTGHER